MSSKNSITNGFIEELKTYIPQLRQGIDAFRSTKECQAEVEEFHRLIHIVHGASSLVGLTAVGVVGGLAEKTLEDVLSEKLSMTPEITEALDATLKAFDLFCRDQPPTPQEMTTGLSRSLIRLRRVQQLPEAEDPQALEALDAALLEQSQNLSMEEILPTALDPLMEENFFGWEDAPQKENDLQDEPVSEEIIAVFYEEAEEHFECISTNLSLLEQMVVQPTPMNDLLRENIREVRRGVHTIKGSSALVGMKGLSSWAHHVEDLLDWLFEEATSVEPETVALLLKASDIMVRHVNEPNRVDTSEEEAMVSKFSEVSGFKKIDTPSPADFGIFDSPEEEVQPKEIHTPRQNATPFSGTRLDMGRLDELVNLVSEQMIALSSFDQKLDAFMGVVGELELFNSRLRDTSKSLEVGYEVKSIQGATQPSASIKDHFNQFDALELDRYSEFNLIIRALAESTVDINEIHGQLQHFHSDFEGYMTRHRVLLSELQGKLMQVRMAPMSILTNRMRRTVREVADTLGRNVRLMIQGEEIELDRTIWEKLADPLLHILRNCVDHGIETVDERRALGKPETGIISVAASRQGNQVVIKIRDDGRGIAFDTIRKKAGDRALDLSESELVGLLFEPGFSTRDAVSQTSGRGVGMDVVKANVEAIKGSLSMVSPKAGAGTTLTITIPLTLAVTRAILFSVNGSTFAISLSEVEDILRVEEEAISQIPFPCVKTDDRIIPLYSLSEDLGMDAKTQEEKKERQGSTALKVRPQGEEVLFFVDALLGQREIVIKSLGSHLQYVKGISGATILGDGSIIPILNVGELFAGEKIKNRPNHALPLTETASSDTEVLVVDDSVSVRRVVSRLMEEQGWKAHTARDGMEALEILSDLRPSLIVLDIEMPKMNGYEFLSARKAYPAVKDIPVIMLTSRTTVKYRDKARELGADGYLTKPFHDKTFIDLAHRLTGA